MSKVQDHARLLGFALLIMTFCWGCGKDEGIPNDPSPSVVNLIQNFNFESGSQPSVSGWYSYGAASGWEPIDTAWGGVNVKQDAPTGSSTWALELISGSQAVITDATYFISGQTGTSVYQLSLFGKACTPSPLPHPQSRICLQKGPIKSSYAVTDSSCKCLALDSLQMWKKYLITDTITSLPSDTIFVELITLGTGPITETYRFDLIELTKKDP